MFYCVILCCNLLCEYSNCVWSFELFENADEMMLHIRMSSLSWFASKNKAHWRRTKSNLIPCIEMICCCCSNNSSSLAPSVTGIFSLFFNVSARSFNPVNNGNFSCISTCTERLIFSLLWKEKIGSRKELQCANVSKTDQKNEQVFRFIASKS